MGAEEADQIVQRSTQAGIDAGRAHKPAHAKAVRRLSILGALLSLAVVLSLFAWVRNSAADRATVNCQAAINEQWRVDSAARAEIAGQDRATVDDWIKAVDAALNADPDDQPLQQLRDATEKYLADRAAADQQRSGTPLDPFTGRC